MATFIISNLKSIHLTDEESVLSLCIFFFGRFFVEEGLHSTFTKRNNANYNAAKKPDIS